MRSAGLRIMLAAMLLLGVGVGAPEPAHAVNQGLFTPPPAATTRRLRSRWLVQRGLLIGRFRAVDHAAPSFMIDGELLGATGEAGDQGAPIRSNPRAATPAKPRQSSMVSDRAFVFTMNTGLGW